MTTRLAPRQRLGDHVTVTPADVVIYRADLAAGQSVARVQAGER